ERLDDGEVASALPFRKGAIACRIELHDWCPPHCLAEALSRLSTTTLAFTILVGQRRLVKPAATAEKACPGPDPVVVPVFGKAHAPPISSSAVSRAVRCGA